MSDMKDEGGAVYKPTLCMINHGGERYIAESLGAAVALAERFAGIVFVDDASRDRSVEIVRERFPQVRVVGLPENRGPAAARNVALREASTDRVLLLDNDVVLAPDCVDQLMQALDRHPDAAVAMPRVFYADRPELIQYDGADSHFLGLQILENADLPLAAAPGGVRRIGSLISACFLVDRSRLDASTDFDEPFFIYMEDHDFGVRVRSLGREILSVPAARCYHGKGTEGLSIRSLGRYSRLRVRCLIRNRWQFILKNYSLRSLLLLSPIFAVYELAQLVVVVRKGWVVEWAKAAWWIATHSRELLEKRRAVHRGRRVRNRTLFTGGPIPFRPELTTGRLERAGKRFLDAITSSYWKRVEHLL